MRRRTRSGSKRINLTRSRPASVSAHRRRHSTPGASGLQPVSSGSGVKVGVGGNVGILVGMMVADVAVTCGVCDASRVGVGLVGEGMQATTVNVNQIANSVFGKRAILASLQEILKYLLSKMNHSITGASLEARSLFELELIEL